ncbi:GNAT family N-acetyltransferase [Streptomyces sp. NPDC047000]|uniref:GNAT family N-acetyltransferase n=1 Tax=Streptomyces sp. NPDC047000 TaxID=3155474 RepID=UPI0033C6C5C4
MGDIGIRDDRAAGRLEALGDGGAVVGRIEYFVLGPPGSPERALVPVHTIVEPAHEGQGIGGALARELYGTAAREGVFVVPLCPYVAGWAERHPDDAPAAPPGLRPAAEEWLRAHPGRF